MKKKTWMDGLWSNSNTEEDESENNNNNVNEGQEMKNLKRRNTVSKENN